MRRLPWLLTAVLLTAAATPAGSAPLAGDGTWKRLGPAPRCWGPTAVFDPLRNRMLTFGGSPFDDVIASSYDVVWSLSLAGPHVWTQLAPSGLIPPERGTRRVVRMQ